jgi:CDP-glucose 4,6-dehydratase
MESLALIGVLDGAFWRGKRVLLTGHSGFKGAWLTLWLSRLGANVTGIALPPLTTPNLYTEGKIYTLCESHLCDIRDASTVAELVHRERPEIVFHLAAQPLVYAGYRAPLTTFETNVMGTAHLLDALRALGSARVAVMVTTDKVYRESHTRKPYREHDPLGGYDPYSASKAASEIVIESYRDSFLATQGMAIASARAGNVIGGGDWAADRLIPDAVRAWQAGETLDVRRPEAVRPWQHVLEPLFGYLTLAHQLWDRPDLAGAYNFGPDTAEAVPVRDVIELARATYGEGELRFGDGGATPHEAEWLGLDVTRARRKLRLTSNFTLIEAVTRTMAWYRAHKDGASALQLCETDIADYEARLLPHPAAARAVKQAG